jgi:hypothetical protein
MILEGLEVLQLMADRLETDDSVEPDDMVTVVRFLQDVGCKCLDNTAHLLLQPALRRAKNRELVQRLKTAVSCHHVVGPLVEDAASEIHSKKYFVLHAHLLTKLIGDLILEEEGDLLTQVVNLLDDQEGHRHLEEFAEKERSVSAVAAERIQEMHSLEAKYAYPKVVRATTA